MFRRKGTTENGLDEPNRELRTLIDVLHPPSYRDITSRRLVASAQDAEASTTRCTMRPSNNIVLDFGATTACKSDVTEYKGSSILSYRRALGRRRYWKRALQRKT